ncbi:hypothetical protein ETU08_00370 [Apibacter muscae]|uniref:hypothetical protein n=1 Tax=Apibacter muscae TaxID=2509004 RepID=UPI0011AD94BA|nr:hypothetical protein [Apibacter muscae]TWP31794.1 hypothetical protein ETU08_00370 [Apibacter muscae]
MEKLEEFNNYTFKAITRKGAILIFILILPIFISIYLLMDIFIFYDIKVYNVFTNMKVIGIPMILTYLLITITSNYIIADKYLLETNDNKITIYRNNKYFYLIELYQIKKIICTINSKFKGGSIHIESHNNKLYIITGFFFTKKNNFPIFQEFSNIFFSSLEKKEFSKEKKQKKELITYILTNKN